MVAAKSLAMGCAVVGSDTQPVREFVSHDDTGLLTSFFDPSGLADKVLTVPGGPRSIGTAAPQCARLCRKESLHEGLPGFL